MLLLKDSLKGLFISCKSLLHLFSMKFYILYQFTGICPVSVVCTLLSQQWTLIFFIPKPDKGLVNIVYHALLKNVKALKTNNGNVRFLFPYYQQYSCGQCKAKRSCSENGKSLCDMESSRQNMIFTFLGPNSQYAFQHSQHWTSKNQKP